MSLDILNNADKTRFLQLIGGPLEGETWLAERVLSKRPFADIDALMVAFSEIATQATEAEKIRIIRSHPDLAVAATDELSDTSVREQSSAGLNQLTAAEVSEFQRLNTAYWAKFDFPFVICVREHTKGSILAHFKERLQNNREAEIATGVREVLKIIRLRTIDLLNTSE